MPTEYFLRISEIWAYSTILILNIIIYRYLSIRFGADIIERNFAKGARKKCERRLWPGQEFGQSDFYEIFSKYSSDSKLIS